MRPVPAASLFRRVARSAPAIPCWSASAGSDEGQRPSSFRDGALAPDLRCAIAHRGISRFRVRSFHSRPGMTPSASLPQMLRKKSEAARPGDVGARLVVAGALVAMKTVLRAGIDENFHLRPLGLDGLDVGERNAGILFAKVQ